jgi:hypothetical protein
MLFVERRNQSLEEMFLNLYAIVADEKACLYVLLVFQNGRSMQPWNVRFIRAFIYCELESVDSFFDILYSNNPFFM